MKTLKDLKLSKKTKLKVEQWMNDWLKLLINQSKGREGTVHRADFEKGDFFYFTDCTDILSKNVESRGIEIDREINTRKRLIMAQLLIKNMLGSLETKKVKCSHCGYENRLIESVDDNYTYFYYCPKCKFINICTFPEGLDECISKVKYKLNKRGIKL